MKEGIEEDLLIRYILDEATIPEREQVEAWLAGDRGHLKRFEQLRFLLDHSKRQAPSSPLTAEEAWERFRNKRDLTGNETARVVPLRIRSNWFRIAATALLVIGGGWIAYYLYRGASNGSDLQVTLAAGDQVRVDTLPDGSIVHLNKRSTLVYRGNFRSARKAELTGEAFFEVKHDDAVPFTVQVEDLYIRDVGTAFNIKSRQHQTEIIVKSGVVEVSKHKNSVQLNAQQMVSIRSGDKVFRVEKNIDGLYDYYVNNSFAVNDTPLWRLTEILNEAYGADIRIESDALRNTPITINNINLQAPLQNILELIRLTTPGLHIQKAGSTYILK